MAFFDRFSYKKPKQRDLEGQRRGISCMQPRSNAGSSIYAEAAVNSESFIGQDTAQVRTSKV